MTLELTKIRRAELRAEDDRKNGFKPDLPDSVNLIDREQSLTVWRIMRLTDWRWLPSEVINEPEALLNDLLTIQSHWGAISEIITDKPQQ